VHELGALAVEEQRVKKRAIALDRAAYRQLRDG
jgi:hypothetical protein